MKQHRQNLFGPVEKSGGSRVEAAPPPLSPAKQERDEGVASTEFRRFSTEPIFSEVIRSILFILSNMKTLGARTKEFLTE